MNQKLRYRENNSNWKGGQYITDGRLMIYKPTRPGITTNGYIFEHILKAEKVLKKRLPDKAEIHHLDGDKSNNSNSNLIICEGRAYHFLLHRRMNALKASNHADWRKCLYCKKWDNPENMYSIHQYAYHRKCKNEYIQKKYYSLYPLFSESKNNTDCKNSNANPLYD